MDITKVGLWDQIANVFARNDFVSMYDCLTNSPRKVENKSSKMTYNGVVLRLVTSVRGRGI